MTIEILKGCGPLLSRYDVLLCDIWGVVHDGNRAHEAANDALIRFRSAGGTVVLVSNAPQPAARVAEILDEKAVSRRAWDAIVSSGEIAIRHVRDAGYGTMHHIGPMPRSQPLVTALGLPEVALPDAEVIVCSGLIDDRREVAEDYRPLLETARRRKLSFVCANPDLAVHVGDLLLPCAGALGVLYESMGGGVVWTGKPHAEAYDMALGEAARLRGAVIDRRRVLAVGDAIRTDLAAAAGAGVDSLFVAGGLHRDEVLEAGRLAPAALTRLFSGDAPRPVAATLALDW